jgi:hypothetical protein
MRSFKFIILISIIALIDFRLVYSQDEALKLVKSFIKNLDKQDYKSAYEKASIPSWGDFKHFSSSEAFGSIEAARIFDIKEENDIDSLTGIYVDAEYFDPHNGNARYKEKFYVSKNPGNLKIVKFKLIKKENLPETKLHPSENDIRLFYKQVKTKLDVVDHKDIHDFFFINKSFTKIDTSECFIMRRIESGCDMGYLIGFLCIRNSQGKWILSQIADRYTSLNFYDFDNDSIMEIVDQQDYDCMNGDANSYFIYSWKGNKKKVLYEYNQIFTPVFQFQGGENLSKNDCISDFTEFEISDFNNDGFLELKQSNNICLITKDCVYPESNDDNVIEKFYKDFVLKDNREIVYSYKNGKFVAD